MKKLLFPLLLLTLLSALTGCETTGSARGATTTCQSAGTSGSCTLTIDEIEGTYIRSFENNAFRSVHDAAEVTISVTVGEGSLEVYVDGPDNQHSAVQVSPGGAAEMTGVATISGASKRKFNVYFKAVDGKASDIKAEISYQAR